MTRGQKGWLLLLLALCLAARLGFILQVPASEYFYSDGDDYSRVALGIAEGRGFYPPDMKPNIVYRAPFYPLVLGGIYKAAGGENLVAVRLVHCGLAVLTGLLLFAIGRTLGGLLTGFLALGLFAVHPYFIYHTATVAPETTFIFLTVACYHFLFRFYDRARLRDALAAGFCLGLAAVTKGTVLLIIPAACLTAVLLLRTSWRRAWAGAALFVLTALLVIAPLSAYTYARWHEFSLILDGSGLNFWIANSEESVRLFRAETPEEFKRIQRTLWMEVLPAFEQEIGALAPASRDAFYFRRGWEELRAHPGTSLWLAYERLKIFWSPWVHPKVYGLKEVLVSAAATVPLFVLGFATLWRRIRRGCPDAVFAGLAMVLITLVAGMLFNTEIRWRIPLIDTLLILYTALGIASYAARLGFLRRAQFSSSTDAVPV
ncbi:MAG: glycosyltransferase family 39 protein [Nitrospira sp.]|nr:glycosyltransferase family 39 protein [Nitrospira sp.]